MKRITKPLCLLLTTAAVVLLSGCPAKKPIESGRPRVESPTVPQPVPPGRPASFLTVEEAERAYNAGDLARAEQIATAITTRNLAGPAETARIWRVQALAAHGNNHTYLALQALEKWREADRHADSGEEWQTAWKTLLPQLPPYEARSKAMAILDDASRPWPLRADMRLFLAARQWEAGDPAGALDSLTALYQASEDRGSRMRLEHALFDELHRADQAHLDRLAALVTPEHEAEYPYALILLEQYRRNAETGEGRESAQKAVDALKAKSRLADAGIFEAWLAAPRDTTVVPLPGRSIALALPLSGSYSAIGNKVALGAEMARKEFAAAGHTVNIILLDTAGSGWLDQLQQLPAEVTLVGGPLRGQEYASAKERGLTQTRVFLTFLPSLPDQGGAGPDEGRVAWRFFPSPEDQMSALFTLTRSLGITSYAVLMPDDPYARRMVGLFENYAARGGDTIAEKGVYPENQADWNRFVGSFLHTGKNASRPPKVGYKAIFLPDSWQNMEVLIPNLFYYRENRQVLLGTSLWEHGLAAQTHGDPHYYGLAVFPGAWRINDPTPAGETLRLALAREGKEKPDFWVGLGYDFARFAATLDIPPGWSYQQVNSLLSRHGDMPWSMAPIRWSLSGKGSQELFLLTPQVDGFISVNPETFRRRFETVWK